MATGAVQRLTHDAGTAPWTVDWQPAWSPDGRKIVWDRFERCFRCTGVWLMDADGTDAHEIFANDARRPAWSPDGTKLSLSLSGALVIDAGGNVVLQGSGAYTTWSPRGAYVVDVGSELELHNLLTGTSREIGQLIRAKPVWSPDGKVIAGEGRFSRVTIVRAKDGTLVARIAKSSTVAGGPSWSRTTGRLAFTHADECGIDVARQDGSHLRRLTSVC